jgi:hypothetical protein
MITYYYAAADYPHADRGMIPDYPVPTQLATF